MVIEKIPIDRLNAAPYNPRVELKPGDPVYESLKKSVETFGYLQPIIVNRRNSTVVGGHQRLKVLKDLGYEEVDVVFVDVSAEHEKALNLTSTRPWASGTSPNSLGCCRSSRGFRTSTFNSPASIPARSVT